jgi:raffinose/stachyose/melibiose transport system substrate-binding protein
MKNKTQLFTFILLITLIVAFPLFAEGEKEEAAEKELEYWCYWDKGHPNDQYFRSIVSDFEKETGIKVEYSNPGRDILQKIRPAILEKNPPDIFDGHGIEMWPALIEDELLLSLEDLYKGDAYTGNTAFENILLEGLDEMWAKDGTRYYVPYTAMTSVIWYDGTMFDKHGISPPQTWGRLLDICQRFKNEGIAPFSQDGGVDFYNAYWYYWFANRIAGAEVFYDAAMDPSGKGWDNPDLLKAAQWVERLAKGDYFIDGFSGYVWPAGQIDWAQGLAAMLLCGSWVPNETFDKVSEDFEFRAFAFPMVQGGNGSYKSVEMATLGWGIPNDAKNPEAAKEFIRFAMQEKYQVKLFDVFYNPARKGLAGEAPDALRDVNRIMNEAESFHKMYDGLQAEAEWWTTVFLPLDDQLLFGKITAEEFIKQVKAGTIEYHEKF